MLTTRKAQELDVVELTEDLPEFGLKKGERGAVVVAFDNPDEAYDLEFVDDSGKSKFAFAVKPDQIKSTDETAKGIFEEGIHLLNRGGLLEAEREFRKAIRLRPDYLGVLHNSIVKSFEGKNEPQRAITALLLVFRLNPNYKIARGNLAIALQKYGIQMLNEEKVDEAMELFQLALTLEPPEDIISDIRTGISAVFTAQGIREHESGQLSDALHRMKQANIVDPNEQTRRNVGIAYLNLAKLFLDKRQFHDALIAFHRAELTGVMSAESLNDYGIALAYAGEMEMASSIFERALELSPSNETIRANLNAIRQGRTTELRKVRNDVEFVLGHAVEKISVQIDPLVGFQPPIYPIDLMNLTAA